MAYESQYYKIRYMLMLERNKCTHIRGEKMRNLATVTEKELTM
jgi:hypothetical protein